MMATTPEQRKHERHVVEIPCLLRLEETRGGVYAVTVLDVSASGLRISAPKPLPANSRVEIRFQNLKIFASVRYTRELGGAFYLGVEADLVETPAGRLAAPDFDLTSLLQSERPRLRRV
jgi:hypothetical protein